LVTCAATAGLALYSLPAAADEAPDLLNEPFYAALGSFIVNTDTQVRLDGQGERGDLVDWEQTFGGGDTTRGGPPAPPGGTAATAPGT